jgi:ABC-type uncharacterized transport system auxiliary subunit
MKNVIHRLFRLVFLLLIPLLFSAVFLFTGCLSQEVKDITYYVLEYRQYPGFTQPKRKKAYSETVLVEDATVVELYSRRELVWRGEGPVVGYFDFHHWGIRLTRMASDLIAEAVEKSGFFSSVYRKYRIEKAEYIIVPVIERIEMVKGTEEELPKVRLEMEFQWHSSNSVEPLFRHTVTYNREMADEEPVTYVLMVNRLLLEGTKEFLETLASWKDNPGDGN